MLTCFTTKYHKDCLDKNCLDKCLSAKYPQSGVLSAKRIIFDNVAPDSSLHSDNTAGAILKYRSTPLPGINLNPAQILFTDNFEIRQPIIVYTMTGLF